VSAPEGSHIKSDPENQGGPENRQVGHNGRMTTLTVDRAQLTIDVGQLLAGSDLAAAGATWTIRVEADAGSLTAGDELVSTAEIDDGILDADGTATASAAVSPTGSFYLLEISGIGRWRFQVDTGDLPGPVSVAALARRFGPLRPLGPTPGAPGPPGPYYSRLYLAAPESPAPAAPTAWITPSTGAITRTGAWSTEPATPGDGETLWVSETRTTDTTSTVPAAAAWGDPFEAGGTGPPGRGIKGITDADDAITIDLTDGSTEGPFTLPAGRGIKNITQTDAATIVITLDDDSTVTVTLPAGRGIKSIAEAKDQLTITLTDDSTEGPFALPPGVAGRGIKSIAEANHALTITLTDDTTQGPFTLPAGPKGAPGAPGSLALTPAAWIDNAQNGVSSPFLATESSGPVGPDDLNDILSFSFRYTRSGNTGLFHSFMVTKAAIPELDGTASLAAILKLQAQGAGGDYFGIFFDTSEANRLTLRPDTNSISDINIVISNVTSGLTGRGIKSIAEANGQLTITLTDDTTQGPFTLPKPFSWLTGSAAPTDDQGSDGDFYLQVLGSEAAVIYEKSSGTWVKYTDATKVAANPAGTDGDTLTRLAVAGTNFQLPDVSGIAANTAAITAEAQARKTEDGKLAGRIDAADIKIAANKTAIDGVSVPDPSDTAPGNTPGSPSAGTSAEWSRADHDHGITAGGATFEPTQANLYPAVSPMIEAETASATVNPILGSDDDSNHLIKLGVAREIIGTDWGNLAVGHTFRPGNVVPRTGRWYGCIKAHAKGGTGPDNDPANWIVLTSWAGQWKAGWYDPGEEVLDGGDIWKTTVAVVNTDPAPSHADNTKWLRLTGGGGGGGGTGQRTLLDTASGTGTVEVQVTRSEWTTAFPAAPWRAGEVIQFVVEAVTTSAREYDGLIRVTPGDDAYDFVNDNQDSYSAGLYVSGNSKAAAVRSYFVVTDVPAAGTQSVIAARLSGDAGGTATVNVYAVRSGSPDAFRPSQAALYPFVAPMAAAKAGIAVTPDPVRSEIGIGLDLTPALLHPVERQTWAAGRNVELVHQDTDNRTVINADAPDPAAPRIRAIDSRDLRNVQPPYSYNQISRGFELTSDRTHTLNQLLTIHGRDNNRPGFANDTNNGRRNSNGKQFSNQTAGTTDRKIDIAIEVQMANERSYGADEKLRVDVRAYGRAKAKSSDADGVIQWTETFSFVGGFQDAFNLSFELEYSANPRVGEHDGYRVDITHISGSAEVTGSVVNAVKETFTLPALGSIPRQTFSLHESRHLSTLADWIPPTLKTTAASRIITWTIGTPNNSGRNGPDESDKADVQDPVWQFGSDDQNALDKPWMVCPQDLSRLKLSIQGGGHAGGGDLYLCTRVEGLELKVLGSASAAAAWTIDWQGPTLSGQEFYVIDLAGGGPGPPVVATWDANPTTPRINNVVDGIEHTARLQAGINYTPGTASVFTIQDSELVKAAKAGLLDALHIDSGGVIDSARLSVLPRPLPFGEANVAHAVGPMFLRGSRTGHATTKVYARMWYDQTGVHIRLAGDQKPITGEQSVYCSGVEVAYLKYQDEGAIW